MVGVENAQFLHTVHSMLVFHQKGRLFILRVEERGKVGDAIYVTQPFDQYLFPRKLSLRPNGVVRVHIKVLALVIIFGLSEVMDNAVVVPFSW